MDNITIDVAIYSWLIFWTTYWVFGSLISWKAHISNIRKIKKLREVISVVIINMFWTLFGIVLLYLCPIRAFTDSHIIIKIFLTYIATDIWFYHFHLLIHHPQLYKKIHKLHHHEMMAQPYALTSLYCQPYEAIFLNVFSTSIGPVICQLPPPYIYIWYFLISLNSVATHSGITIPYILDGSHDKHHQHFNVYYGISIYFDWIYGTCLEETTEEKENNTKCLGNFPINIDQMERF